MAILTIGRERWILNQEKLCQLCGFLMPQKMLYTSRQGVQRCRPLKAEPKPTPEPGAAGLQST